MESKQIAHWGDKFSTDALGEMLFNNLYKYGYIIDTATSIK